MKTVRTFFCPKPGVLVYEVLWPAGMTDRVTITCNPSHWAIATPAMVLEYVSRLVFALHGACAVYAHYQYCTELAIAQEIEEQHHLR